MHQLFRYCITVPRYFRCNTGRGIVIDYNVKCIYNIHITYYTKSNLDSGMSHSEGRVMRVLIIYYYIEFARSIFKNPRQYYYYYLLYIVYSQHRFRDFRPKMIRKPLVFYYLLVLSRLDMDIFSSILMIIFLISFFFSLSLDYDPDFLGGSVVGSLRSP